MNHLKIYTIVHTVLHNIIQQCYNIPLNPRCFSGIWIFLKIFKWNKKQHQSIFQKQTFKTSNSTSTVSFQSSNIIVQISPQYPKDTFELHYYLLFILFLFSVKPISRKKKTLHKITKLGVLSTPIYLFIESEVWIFL